MLEIGNLSALSLFPYQPGYKSIPSGHPLKTFGVTEFSTLYYLSSFSLIFAFDVSYVLSCDFLEFNVLFAGFFLSFFKQPNFILFIYFLSFYHFLGHSHGIWKFPG